MCENMDTSINMVKLSNLTASLNPGCHLVTPARGERCHRFDNFGHEQAIPRVVLSAAHLKVGLSMPLHPFIVEISERYDLTPFQLTPTPIALRFVCIFCTISSSKPHFLPKNLAFISWKNRERILEASTWLPGMSTATCVFGKMKRVCLDGSNTFCTAMAALSTRRTSLPPLVSVSLIISSFSWMW